MRHDRIDCTIYNDSSTFSYEFIKSLRFSTHCNFYLSNGIINSDLYKYFNDLENETNDYFISIKNSYVYFGEKNIPNTDKKIYYKYNIHGHDTTEALNNLSFIMLSDVNSELELLGIIDMELFEVLDHNNVSLSSKVIELVKSHTDQDRFTKNSLFRIQISAMDGTQDLCIEVSNNMYYKEFETYRASGINIPLVIVQKLYNRKVKTFKFISQMKTSVDNKPSFSGEFDTIYFDLDETLMWSESETEIAEMIQFLKIALSKGYTIKLLTRHEKPINESLNKIGLQPALFSEIIKVEIDELKSSFVIGKSIFIDNEFPQRYDVNFSAGIPSFDLDQIDFINL